MNTSVIENIFDFCISVTEIYDYIRSFLHFVNISNDVRDCYNDLVRVNYLSFPVFFMHT